MPCYGRSDDGALVSTALALSSAVRQLRSVCHPIDVGLQNCTLNLKVTAMQTNTKIQARLDIICLQRLISSDFAQKPNLKSRIIRWMKGGAK